jgi:hypothetical protein
MLHFQVHNSHTYCRHKFPFLSDLSRLIQSTIYIYIYIYVHTYTHICMCVCVYAYTLALDWSGWLKPRHGGFTRGTQTRPIHCLWGWVGLGAVCAGTEDIYSTVVQTPDLPARSETCNDYALSFTLSTINNVVYCILFSRSSNHKKLHLAGSFLRSC